MAAPQPMRPVEHGGNPARRYDAPVNERMDVAITGGDGLIAGILRAGLSDRFKPRWLSRSDADVTDLAVLEHAFAGADAVVHLAATAKLAASW